MGPVVDAETGFVYLRARYYDPATGQFLTRDPMEAQTRSAYGYVDGNPLNGTDPSGLYPGEGLVNTVVGAGGAVVGAGGSVIGAVRGVTAGAAGWAWKSRDTIIGLAAAGTCFVAGATAAAATAGAGAPVAATACGSLTSAYFANGVGTAIGTNDILPGGASANWGGFGEDAAWIGVDFAIDRAGGALLQRGLPRLLPAWYIRQRTDIPWAASAGNELVGLAAAWMARSCA